LSLPDLLLIKGKLSLNIELRKALENNSTKLVQKWNILIGKEEPTAELFIDSLLAVEVKNKKSDVITLVPGKAETIRLSWLSEFEKAPEEVEIKVVDYIIIPMRW